MDATPSNEEEIRQRVLREREQAEAERAREKELEEESVQLDKEIEQEIRGSFTAHLFHDVQGILQTDSLLVISSACGADLTEEERTSIFTAPEFLNFVEQSSKIVQRALNDSYDYIQDYTTGAETGTYVLPFLS